MKKLVMYPLSVLYYLLFGFLLVFFHVIQWITLKIGPKTHSYSVAVLNWFLLKIHLVLGNTFRLEEEMPVPKDVPIILVSNHQSTYDMPMIIWHFRNHHVKFVAKKELGKGIPSISFNLRNGGSVLIDRKDARSALRGIANFAKYINQNKLAAVIFPEGTRSRTGKPKKFSENGLKVLSKYCKEDGFVVPITINNTWEIEKNGFFPMNIGVKTKFKVHKPIKISDYTFDRLLDLTEKKIINSVE